MDHRRIYRCVVLLSVAVCLTRSSPRITGIITPKTPSAFHGRTLTLNCTLVGNITNGISSRDIAFEFTNDDVKSKAVRKVIDERTARLTIHKAFLNISSSRISCHLRNETLDEVAIFIERPRFPNITGCIVYNWERMTCTWDWDETDNMSMSMAFSRSRLRCHNSMTKYECPNLVQEKIVGSCIWKAFDITYGNAFLHVEHCVWLKATNAYNATALNNVMSVAVDKIVKPNPIEVRTIEIASENITLGWTSPKDYKTIIYRLTYESRLSKKEVKNTTDTRITLSNLIPNTKYNITADCIPLVSNIALGFWSDQYSVAVTTLPDLPGGTPSVTTGGFLVLERNSTHRNIKLFFQPVSDMLSHGEFKAYRVGYSIGNATVKFETSSRTTYLVLSLEIEEVCVVSMEMENVLGYNESLAPSTVVIGQESKLPSFPENFVVQYDNNVTYTLTWTLVDQASSYTLYWCSKPVSIRLFDCTNALEWKILPSSQTSEVLEIITLSDPSVPPVRFALSVEKMTATGETVSSGMWIANCTYQKNGELKSPEDARLMPNPPHSVTVLWTRPDRTGSLGKDCNGIAYAPHYIISYCPVKHCEETGKMVNVTVESFRDEVTIDGLDMSEDYRFLIRSLSKTGKSSTPVLIWNGKMDAAKQLGKSSFPVGLTVVLVVIFAASCAVPVVVKVICYWQKRWHIEVKPPPKYFNKTQAPAAETTGYSTFLVTDLTSDGQFQTTVWEQQHGHGYSNSAAFQPCENESLLSRQNSGYKSSVSSSELSTMPSTQSNSASSKCSDPRRDSGLSASISGYNVVIEQPSETSGSSGGFLASAPCEEGAIATTQIC